MNLLRYSVILLTALSITPSSAETLDHAKNIQDRTNHESARSQQVIDNSSSASTQMQTSIEQLQAEIRNLKIYREHLQSMVKNQNDEASSFDQQLREIKETRQGIIPLMYRMLDGLKQIIDHDKPIKLEQRKRRLEKLVALMGRADVSEAEKYRRILEAYQIEIDYGNKIATYRDAISLDGHVPLEADILYVGRLTLIARSLDHQKFWVWDTTARRWVPGDDGELSHVNQAYRLAHKQIAPTLLNLPLSLKATGGQ
jgi:hypothetical protein